ncbi:DNA polymerase III subunit chi [Stenoxybacter acetivorans]|uniref:DNA polymerase III subunit chi n=1 Tax=Stenoxybacter acetivorans TaxID=422441 RepID=UPI0005638161|nr:DNA polymerase III subunit chi [Stenoxybacter acetivorans]
MPEAVFYVHVANIPQFACRLAQKAHQDGRRVLVWLADEAEQQRINTLLWTFSSTAFVPHCVWQTEQNQPAQNEVALGCGDELPEIAADTVVLNMSTAFWSDAPIQPARVLEIIGAGVDDLALGRSRFAAYRRAGFVLTHHNMQDKA